MMLWPSHPLEFLAMPGLWIGLAIAATCIAGAVRLRRYRIRSEDARSGLKSKFRRQNIFILREVPRRRRERRFEFPAGDPQGELLSLTRYSHRLPSRRSLCTPAHCCTAT